MRPELRSRDSFGTLALVTAMAFVLASCGQRAPTQILLAIDSDIVTATHGGPFTAVRVVVRRDGAAPFYDQRFDLSAGFFTLPGEVALTARDPSDARRVIIAVTAEVSGSESSFTESVATHFESGHVLLLQMFLANRCTRAANRMCPQGETCMGSGCAASNLPDLPDAPPPDAGLGFDASLADATIEAGDERAVPDVQRADVPTGAFCGPDRALCSGECASILVDRDHCGACDRVCAASEFCGEGLCTACAGATHAQMCGGFCRDTANDAAHCGNCATACPANQGCSGGVCMRVSYRCEHEQDIVLAPGLTSVSDVFDVASTLRAPGACTPSASAWYRFWLDQRELVYVTSTTAGAVGLGNTCGDPGIACATSSACGDTTLRVLSGPASHYVVSSAGPSETMNHSVGLDLMHMPIGDAIPVELTIPMFNANGRPGTIDTPRSCAPGADSVFYLRTCGTGASGPITLSVCPAPAGGGMTAVAVRDLASGADSCAMVGCGTPTPIGQSPRSPGALVFVVERADSITVTGRLQ